MLIFPATSEIHKNSSIISLFSTFSVGFIYLCSMSHKVEIVDSSKIFRAFSVERIRLHQACEQFINSNKSQFQSGRARECRTSEHMFRFVCLLSHRIKIGSNHRHVILGLKHIFDCLLPMMCKMTRHCADTPKRSNCIFILTKCR